VSPRRAVATLLVTDIVGSTEHAARLGDRGWRTLLDQHHEAVRRELRRFGGREINTAGDAFLAAFNDPEAAIRCALAIREAVRAVGLEIRSGLHMGQIEGEGREARGIALHIASRVASLAGAGEVLASSTVRDALAGSGFAFEDRGAHTLKGVPGDWPLAAVSEDASGGPLPVMRPRAVRVVAAAALVLAVAAGGLFLRQHAGRTKAGGPGPADSGHRLEGAEAAGPGDSALAARSTPTGRPAGASATPASDVVTLAVLPFQTLNAPDEIGFLGIGVADAVITQLANAKRLQLRPTRAILRYENQAVDVKQAGRELQVDYVLTGTLLRAGDRLRVNTQLVRSSDGTPLWGHKDELERGDLLTLQDSIAQRVASTLELEMRGAEGDRVYRRYTANAAAYERYLEGRSLLAKLTKESVSAAVGKFEEALRLDPSYALAHAGLATAAAQTSTRFASESEIDAWADRARREAARVLELDPDLAEAHEALAAVYRNSEYDWERTIEESDRALRLNPHLELPHYYKAGAFYHLGLFDLAESEVLAGMQVNPVDRVEPQRLRGTIAFFAGRYGDAERFLEEVERRSHSPSAEWYLSQALYYNGEVARAESLLVGLARGQGSMRRRAQASLASFRAAAGDRARALEWARQAESGPYKDHHVAYALGVAYAQLGQPAEALRWLTRAADTGIPCYPWFERDPLLKPLRGDAQFRAFIADLRKQWEAAKARYAG
jgi:class 3 adenylate cyclase/TolB-like protein